MTPVYIKITEKGSKFYFKDKAMNIRHREDGPAFEGVNGYKYWFSNGKRHREDGPAIEDWWGNKSWYLNGKLHREDGPAIEDSNAYKAWWLNGERLSKAEFLKRTAKEIVLTMDEIADKLGIDVSKLKIKK